MTQYDSAVSTTSEASPLDDVSVESLTPEELMELESQLASGDTLVIDDARSEWQSYDLDFADPLGGDAERKLQDLANAHLVVRVRGAGEGKLTFPKSDAIKAYKVVDSVSQVTYHVYGDGENIFKLMKAAVFVSPDLGAVQFQTLIYANNSTGEPDPLAKGFYVLESETAADNGLDNPKLVKSAGRAQLPDLPEDEQASEQFDRPTFVTDDTLPYEELVGNGLGVGGVAFLDQDPDAIDDFVRTEINVPVTVDVLANDLDPDGRGITLVGIVDGPANGVAQVVGDQIVYSPNQGFSSFDSLRYLIRDANGDEDVATVTIDVVDSNRPPIARSDVIIFTEEDVSITTDESFRQNFTDPDGDPVIIKGIATPPVNGKLTLDASGNLTYDPDLNYNGGDVATVIISDGLEDIEVPINIVVTPVNDAPVANHDSAVTLEDTSVAIDVLANDSDPVEGDAIALTDIVRQPQHGTALIDAGQVVYTPNPGYSGKDDFVYEITDEGGATAVASVDVDVEAVNTAPEAADDSAITSEDMPVEIDVLNNDVDADGDVISVKNVASGPANGSVAIRNDGTILYTPNSGFSGQDTFRYTVQDENGATDVADVTVVVEPMDPAEAKDDFATTNEDTTVIVDVLANDSDPRGDGLAIGEISDAPQHGSVNIVDGTVQYTPDANFNGSDEFTYTIEDGDGGQDSARVTIDVKPVNDDPEANPDDVTVDEDNSISIDVVSNDTDVDGDVLRPESVEQGPSNGTAVVEGGKIKYTPDADFNGKDSFTYKVVDDNGGESTAVVNVDVIPVNDAPVAVSDDVFTPEDNKVTFNVLLNDKDVDGDDLKLVELVSQPKHGEILSVDNTTGAITYSPNQDYNGSDTFEYRVEDGNGGFDVGVVNLQVGSVNDNPTADPDVIFIS